MIQIPEHGTKAAMRPVISPGLFFLLTVRVAPPSAPVNRNGWAQFHQSKHSVLMN